MERGTDSRFGSGRRGALSRVRRFVRMESVGGSRRQPARSRANRRVEKRKGYCPEKPLPPSQERFRPPPRQPAMECGADSRMEVDGRARCPECAGPSVWKTHRTELKLKLKLTGAWKVRDAGDPRGQPARSRADHRFKKRKGSCPEKPSPPSLESLLRPPSCQPAMERRTDSRMDMAGEARCPECAGPNRWENVAQPRHPAASCDGCRRPALCGCRSWMGEQHVVASSRGG